MINLSKLLTRVDSESDGLRYKTSSEETQIKHSDNMSEEKPVVVWNMTRACNLDCLHCYAGAVGDSPGKELTTRESKRMMDQLAELGVPVLIFSGGEPLLRDDLMELGKYSADLGIRPVISTNGTLIDRAKAEEIKDSGFCYVGVSLDGVGEENDRFRGTPKAFRKTLKGLRALQEAGLKTGLRYTLTEKNADSLSAVLDLVIEEGLDRLCVYHLDYTGRANANLDLPAQKKRRLLRALFRWTERTNSTSGSVEVLTVGNYADAGFLYLYVQEQKQTADDVYRLLAKNEGDGAGETIACVDSTGEVHPNQFWRDLSFGNVKERPFREIWYDTSHPVLRGLKDKQKHLKGRCLSCNFLQICEGGSRSRARAATGDVWAPDPACYLTEGERHGDS